MPHHQYILQKFKNKITLLPRITFSYCEKPAMCRNNSAMYFLCDDQWPSTECIPIME